jgi:D-alanyl-D-alanine carboxypeptidase (penicillin-binding protein 5/6)
MLDYGFSLYEARALCDIGSFSYIMPISGGNVDHIMLENAQKITVILPRDTGDIECVVELPRFCLAPTKAGEEIGKLVYYLDGERIAESSIIAKTSADSSKAKGFWARIFNQ